MNSRGRKPRRYSEGRVCKDRGCSTKLSTYNRAEYCHSHAPRRFPRVRGRVVAES
jgi:hypothetical protein